jgi:hypothetical protein
MATTERFLGRRYWGQHEGRQYLTRDATLSQPRLTGDFHHQIGSAYRPAEGKESVTDLSLSTVTFWLAVMPFAVPLSVWGV